MKMTDEQLAEKVYATFTPQYMTTKGEIWEYLIDKNGGNTKAAASEGGRILSGETSGKAYRNARRNFEARNGKMSSLNASTAKWKELGQKLPPTRMKPPKKVKITFKGRVKVSEGRKGKGKGKDAKYNGKQRGDGWVKAGFSREFTGTDILGPSFDALFSEYFTNFQSNPVTDYDVSSLSVEAEN